MLASINDFSIFSISEIISKLFALISSFQKQVSSQFPYTLYSKKRFRKGLFFALFNNLRGTKTQRLTKLHIFNNSALIKTLPSELKSKIT